MKLKYAAVIAVVVLLSLDVIFYALDYSATAVKLSEPRDGKTLPQTFTVAGDAWDRSVDSGHSLEVVATKRDGTVVRQTAARDAVRYGDTTAFFLTSFNVDLTVPSDGEWRVETVLRTEEGNEHRSAPRTVNVVQGATDTTFVHFSPVHLVSAGIVVALCVFVGVYFPRRASPADKTIAEAVIAGGLWLNEVAYHIYWYATGGWMVTHSLLIQMCGLSILLLTFVFTVENEKLRRVLFEIIFFWGIGGALQALLAPDIGVRSFPDYRFFSFFISHGLIIVGGVYIVAGRGFRPTPVSLVRVLVISNVAVAVTWAFNMLLTVVPPYQPGNYFMTGYPPPTGSVIDTMAEVFGPAPRYLIGLELMGLAVFVVLWLPFGMARAFQRRS